MASLEQQRWRRFGWNAARYALGPIGGLVVPWLVLRNGDFGAWGATVGVMIWAQLIAHVLSWGNKDVLLRAFNSEPERSGDLWLSNIVARARMAGPIILLLMSATLLFGQVMNDIAAWTLLLICSGAFESLVVWKKRFGSAFIIDVFVLIVQVSMLMLDGQLTHAVIIRSFLFGQLVRTGLYFFVFGSVFMPSVMARSRRHKPFTILHMINPFRRKWETREMLLTGLPFFLIGFSGLLASRIDLYTANTLLDRVEVGRYQIVASLFIQFQALAALVIAPLTKDLYRLNVESVSRYTQRMRSWAFIGLLPMCVIAWAVFTFLFTFELHWSVYASACALVWPVFAYVPVINQLYKHNRERPVMWANFAAAALTCSLTFVLLPKLGIAGGLLAAAAGQWLMLAWMKREEHRLHALPRM